MIEWIVSSSALIVLIIALRRLLKGKISQRLQYGLWALVLIRLLIPVSFLDTPVSVSNIMHDINRSSAVREVVTALGDYENAYDLLRARYNCEGTDVTPGQLRQEARDQMYQDTFEGVRTEHTGDAVSDELLALGTRLWVGWISMIDLAAELLPHIWYAGMILVAVVFLGSNIIFGLKLRKNRTYCDAPGIPLQVYRSPCIETPCLFGFLNPAIYLTDEIQGDSGMCIHVLAHELRHYVHLDHVWSLLRCVCLVLHWYNPLVWAAAVLSKQDAELACDEATIIALGEDERVAYGRTLIGMTCVKRDPRGLLLTATMMLDSKKTLKERITLIAESPKTARYARIACIWAVVIAAVCTFTGAAPIVTPIDVTLEAVKLDADGNELGIYSIHIQGNQFDYFLDQDRLDVTISSFDNLESVMAATYIHKYGETVGAITKSQWEDYFRVSYGAWNTTTDDMVFASLCFSEDLDRWVFSNDSDKFYYVASVSGAYSAMELAEYFQYITPASRFETEEAHD